jgi:lambda family phage portal protein
VLKGRATSTVRTAVDGGTERWDPSVGRWRHQAIAPAPVQPAAPVPPAPAPGASMGAAARVVRGVSSRAYSSARHTLGTGGFGGGPSSADAELSSHLSTLRARARQVIRDSGYAKRARGVIVNNVIGGGIGLQAQVMSARGTAARRINDAIEWAHIDWCAADSCHIGGAMHFHDLERMAMGEVFEAGEVIVRKHYHRVGDSRVPLTLEVIESERLPLDIVAPDLGLHSGNDLRMGIEQDAYGRAIAYWIRRQHPGDIRAQRTAPDLYERVPAADIFHLRIIDRWPQSRGEPWMHTAMRKLDDLSEYSQHEVSAARAGAAYFATIKRGEDGTPPAIGTVDPNGQPVMEIEAMMVHELNHGEELTFHTPNRPNSALDPFMRAMLREVAAGTGVSYESLSRDYSQSNYSSSRLSLLEDRDTFKVLQQWWIRSFRMPLYRVWLQQAVLAGAIPGLTVAAYAADPVRYSRVQFKPRGWSWVDPTKEVGAYKEAIRGGLTTLTDVIAATGGGVDIEDVIEARKRELQLMREAGLTTDTEGVIAAAPQPSPPAEGPPPDEDEPNPSAARVLRMRKS